MTVYRFSALLEGAGKPYFPTQNLEKISSMTASFAVSPEMTPSASHARRMSSAYSSQGASSTAASAAQTAACAAPTAR